MADGIRDPPPGLLDLAVINRGQKIIDELKKSYFPSKYALYAAVFTGFRSVRLAAEWISSRLNDPLFIKDFEVDFHVLLSLGGNFESDVSSFLSAARVALGWDYVCDHRAQIPLLHLRVKPHDALHLKSVFVKSFGLSIPLVTDDKPLEFLVNTDTSVVCKFSDSRIYTLLQKLSETFLENLKKADVNVCVVSNPGKLNYPFTLVSGINNAEKNSVLIQLNEMYLSNHYIINEFDQSVNNQPKFCLYSHDPRLRDPSYEVFEMLTDVESYPFSPLISSHITNDCNKSGDQKSSTFIACDTKLTDSSNDNQSQCDVSLNQVPACVINSTGCRERFLEHYVGDYILLFDSVSLTERQGCPVGINLCTGESGLFNISAGRRIPQSQTWTLHCSVPLNFTSSAKSCFKQHCPTSTNNVNYSEEFKKLTSQNSSVIAKNINSTCLVLSPCLSNSSEYSSSFFSSSSSSSSSSDPVKSKSSVQTSITTNNNNNNTTDKHITDNRCDSYFTSGANSTCQNEFQLSLNNDELNEANSKYTNNYQSTVKRHNHNKSRQIYVMRHAERVDISFGHGWITQCFNHKGVYRRFNLNLPPWLPTRTDCLEYILDSPITQIGLFVSAETGRALADAGVYFTACYCSPAFRCVQTACELLRAMGRSDLSIRIEPHLFEWYGWYVGGCIPKMMTVHQLKQAGYNVDTNYTSLSSYNDNDKYESIQGYCDRTAVLIKRILNVHKSKDTCLLIVAHASSLDTCTRHLVCHKFRNNLSSNEFHHRTSIVPYCGLLLAQENRRWNLINPPIPNSCSYTRNIDFDWKQLLGPSLCNFKLR